MGPTEASSVGAFAHRGWGARVIGGVLVSELEVGERCDRSRYHPGVTWKLSKFAARLDSTVMFQYITQANTRDTRMI